MIEDTSSTDILIITGGMVGVSLLLMYVIQAFKDFLPGLHGRAAMAMVYAVAMLVSAAVLHQVDGTYDLEWFLALLVATASWAEISKGLYAKVYGREIKVEDMSPDELHMLQRKVDRAFANGYEYHVTDATPMERTESG